MKTKSHNTLAQWLDYLENLHPTEIELGLDRIYQVAQRLLPDLFDSNGTQSAPFKIITVGGTNGKGSTIAFIQSILIESGYKTGTYTSPHFLEFNERIQINAQNISDKDLCIAFEHIEIARGNISLTYFEYTTLASFYYFYQSQCDVIVLEVGLGGRLDGVNILDANCSLVTTVDLDHQDWLGDTKEIIAYEKAGIYRTGKISIYGDNDTPDSLLRYSQKIVSNLYQYGVDYSYTKQKDVWSIKILNPSLITCSAVNASEINASLIGNLVQLRYPQLTGEIQFKNATNAIISLLSNTKDFDKVSIQSINEGIHKAYIMGRCQYLSHLPDVIVDVAHNPQAAKQLSCFLKESANIKNHAIFSILSDKDIGAVINELKSSFSSWHIIPLDSPRALPTQQIKNNLQRHIKNKPITCYNDFPTAYKTVMEEIKLMDQSFSENRIIVFGSFLNVAQAMEYFHAR
jgi:dihydrofolate synthase/folylpolyglutamate synthase